MGNYGTPFSYRRFVYHCIKVPFNVTGCYSDTEVNYPSITNMEKMVTAMTIADKINSILYSSQYRHVFGDMAIFTLISHPVMLTLTDSC